MTSCTVSGDGSGDSLALAKATGEKVYLTLSDLAESSGAFAPNSTTLSLIQYVGNWNGGFFTYGSNELTDGEQFTDTYSNHWTISYAPTPAAELCERDSGQPFHHAEQPHGHPRTRQLAGAGLPGGLRHVAALPPPPLTSRPLPFAWQGRGAANSASPLPMVSQ